MTGPINLNRRNSTNQFVGGVHVVEYNMFKAKDDVVDCDIGDERALLHLESNTYFTLNPTASEIWLALSEPRDLETLVNLITEKFEVAAAVCRPDIEVLLAEMVAANIIEPTSPGGGT